MDVRRHRWALSLAVTAGIGAMWWLVPPARPDAYVSYALWSLVAAACLPLPWRPAVTVLTGAVALQAVLVAINLAKIRLTRAPLTALDFEIALANPRGLWIALGWPLWTRYLVFGGTFAAMGAWTWVTARAVYRHGRPHQVGRRGLAACGVAVAALLAFVVTLPRALEQHANDDGDMWNTEGLSAYATRTGIVPFLVHSFSLERTNRGAYYTDSTGPPLSAEETHRAAASLIDASAAPAQLPNIAVVFAESTFNPNWAFTLARPVESALFRPQRDTHVLSSLYVNTVGGGSWITEFESIVGVDSRLFGYSGYYTHTVLSPFVRRSLATYLRDKGYQTAAYYSWAANFYNAKNAYGNYGFEHFFDVHDLGLEEFAGSDTDVATRAIEQMRTLPNRDRPQFSYIVLYENHPPHRCEHFTQTGRLPVVFGTDVPFAMNCELNEYVRHLPSTARAADVVAAHLAGEERRTGRPYVLVVFGDHQPHTFTSTRPAQSLHDYRRQRTSASDRETFLHVRGSAANPLVRCCTGDPPPAFLLPTLMSAYVAKRTEDLYLPQNLAVFEGCGSEILGSVRVGVGEPQSRAVTRAARAGCRATYSRWLSSIRAAGVI